MSERRLMTLTNAERARLAEMRQAAEGAIPPETVGFPLSFDENYQRRLAAYRAAMTTVPPDMMVRLLDLVARLEGERDEAVTERDARESGWVEAHEQRYRAYSLEVRLGEIAELCGPGGDDTPFGRVESMLASLTDRAEQAEAERDALTARVRRLQARVDALFSAASLGRAALGRHDRWCGHSRNAPGDAIIHQAERALTEALDPSRCLDCGTLDYIDGRAHYEDGIRCMACATVAALKEQP